MSEKSKIDPPVGSSAEAGSRLAATPETDAYVCRVSETKATWDTIEEWSTACVLMSNHARKMERERDAITTNAAREIADLRETLRHIIAHDGPGFPHGTCAQLAEDALGPENVTEHTTPRNKA
jgi:hypothetical protein